MGVYPSTKPRMGKNFFIIFLLFKKMRGRGARREKEILIFISICYFFVASSSGGYVILF
jgi:hypothetical protein